MVFVWSKYLQSAHELGRGSFPPVLPPHSGMLAAPLKRCVGCPCALKKNFGRSTDASVRSVPSSRATTLVYLTP